DRQVVPAEPERGRPECDAEHGRDHRAAHEEEQERQVLVAERRCPEGVQVRAEGEERRVAEVEEAREADDDVQAQCQQDEHAGVHEAADPGVLALDEAERRECRPDVQQDRADGHADDDRPRAMGMGEIDHPLAPRLADARAVRRLCRLVRFDDRRRAHARSPTCWPRMPAGRNTRTWVRATKTENSAQRVSPSEAAKFSMNPITKPPRTAPVMLPMPPRTADVNDLRPALKPKSCRTKPKL